MRIESNQRVALSGVRGSGRTDGGSARFNVAGEGNAPRAAALDAAPAVASLDALLALQAVEDPLFKKRKLVRRGRALLEALDSLRTELLTGTLGEGRLNQLVALVGQARDRSEPELDALLDEIELRVQVELAKRGRFVGG